MMQYAEISGPYSLIKMNEAIADATLTIIERIEDTARSIEPLFLR